MSTDKVLETLLDLKNTSWRYKIISNPIIMSTVLVIIIMVLITFLYDKGTFQLMFYIFCAVLLFFFIHNNFLIKDIRAQKVSDKIVELFGTSPSSYNRVINETRPNIYPGTENLVVNGGYTGGYAPGGGVNGAADPLVGIPGLSDEFA